MSYKQRCTETVIMIKMSNGKCKALRALLDSSCTKTILLKQFTEQSNRIYLPPDQQVKYKTYGGYFTSTLVANIKFNFVEFDMYRDRAVEYEVQVDGLQQRSKTKYDIIIGTDLMDDLDIVLDFSCNQIFMGKGELKDSCPMKDLDALDIEGAQALYEMHTEFDSPMLQTEEERQSKILEADYSKVDIEAMIKGLDIPKDLKRKLKPMLLKHDILFSGGLGKA